ncbi:MAG: hypothetical protein ACJ8KU_01395 [Chthoniobacterales bacterium]
MRSNRFTNNAVRCAAIMAAAMLAASASATIVWDLNPNHQNGPAGSTTLTYTSQGYSITANGFNNNAGIGTPQELFYKSITPVNGASEVGLGVTNTPDNELQAGSSASNPFDFIQFDLSMVLKAGATSGSVSVASIQAGESFAIYGSNSLGTLGTQLGGTYGSSFDNMFVSLPGFGQYNYYSIIAATNDVLPVALSAEIPAVPEMNAIVPVIGLLTVVGAAELLRRRRTA